MIALLFSLYMTKEALMWMEPMEDWNLQYEALAKVEMQYDGQRV